MIMASILRGLCRKSVVNWRFYGTVSSLADGKNMTSPLDVYRKQASFCPKAMRELLEGERTAHKKEIVDILEKDPIFKRNFDVPSLEEARRLNHERWKRIVEYNFIQDPYEDYEKFQALIDVMDTYDQGLGGRFALHANVFVSAIVAMGTKKHDEVLDKARNNQIVGCFCLTELSHGSNTQEVQTTATFDNGDFVIDTPHQGATKVWAGNLAQSATHAIVFAQLYAEGKCHGLHAFVLQVRDPATYDPLPGITIGDMGAKPGEWNGVENGWMIFKKHRAPLWTLLNKGCDVTPEGKYVSSYKSTSERQSVSLGALSVGRIGIIGKGFTACGLAATIAIRYSATRHQFGPAPGAEIPVLDYPLQQHRIFPMLASHYVLRIFHAKFMNYFIEYMMRMSTGEKSDNLAEFSKEVHALSSCAKPVATWTGVEALAEARRACGGHGFLHASRLNSLRDSYDPSQTFEGENNILLQQTSNILLGKAKNGTLETPMGTMKFIRDQVKSFNGFGQCPIEDIISTYQWLVNYLIADTNKEHSNHKANGAFHARNHTQVFKAHTLSIAYAELTAIQWCWDFVKEVDDLKIKKVLTNLCGLYGTQVLEKHLAILYIGGYCTGSEFGQGIRKARLGFEAALAPEVMCLVDAIAPPDFILNSALGASDGRAYDHLMTEFQSHTAKPAWWKDLSDFLKSRNGNSRL